MPKRSWILIFAVLALIAAACGSDDAGEATTTTAATTTTTTEAPGPTIGTEDNPIRVLFVPSVSANEIVIGGQKLARTLEEATGLKFTVAVPTSYASVIQEMCASPDNTIGFIPAQAYVLASELCGVNVALKSLRFGYTEYCAEFIVPRDSEIASLDDLSGKTWAYPDPTSTSGFLVPSGLMKTLGIEPAANFETGGHSATVRAIYNNEADFGTVFFSPTTDVDDVVLWDGTAENADVPADLVESCALDADGQVECSGVYPQDARRGIRSEAPDVIQKVKIIALSDPIPNDTMSFGPAFPADLATLITQAVSAFAVNDPDGFEDAFDAYSWDNVATTSDAEFDFIRSLVQALGITVDDL